MLQIIDPWIAVEDYDSTQIMKNLERACRTCYRSEDKITEDSYKKLLNSYGLKTLAKGEENYVEVYMSYLRKKLKTLNSKAEIKTIRNLGYKLVGESNV